jgi:hypothetical protein
LRPFGNEIGICTTSDGLPSLDAEKYGPARSSKLGRGNPIRRGFPRTPSAAPGARSERLIGMAHREQVMYVELKTNQNDSGHAWIGRVRFSKTGRSIYYRGLTLERRQGISGNHVDIATGDEYWVSGVKRDGRDRHWAGNGPVEIDPDVLDEYLGMLEPSVAARLKRQKKA